MQSTKTFLFIAFFLLLAAAAVQSGGLTDAPPSQQTRDTAQIFLSTLDGEQKARTVYAFDDTERENWHFFPKERAGLPLKDMDTAERRAAHALVSSVLSSRGYLKVNSIMALEAVLRAMEATPDNPALYRDEEGYHVTVFGDPSSEDPFGFRFEGHHISLNVTVLKDQIEVATPFFLGASPHEVLEGPRTGLNVLRREEALGKSLIDSLDDDQRKSALISDETPRDVILGPGREALTLEPRGIPASDMNEKQRSLLLVLIAEYVHNLRGDLAEHEMAQIEATSPGDLFFGFAGGTDDGQPHYYRIQGQTFIIEYDNVQNGANHSHTVWRDTENDFGRDLLREHRTEHSHSRDAESGAGGR